MAIPTTIESLSTTESANGPAGSEQRTLADDGLRQAYAFIKMLVSSGSDIASSSTITPPSTGSSFYITGTTAITTIASTYSWNGRILILSFSGPLVLTHSSNLALPGSVNITTALADYAIFRQEGSGSWRCLLYTRADGDNGTYSPTITNTTNVSSSTSGTCQWSRVGRVVTVSGHIQINPTAASETQTTLGLSLPIASTISDSHQLGGTAAGALTPVLIYGDISNNRATWSFKSQSTVNAVYTFIFQYLVS